MKTLDLSWMKQYGWAIVGRGEGTICVVVPGSTFKDELHDFLCCCGRRECNSETAAEVLEEMKDSANWIFDERGLPYSYSMKLEQAGVEIIRVSKIIGRVGYDLLAAQQVDSNKSIRMYNALRILRAWSNGTAGWDGQVVRIINQWIDDGMKGPIPWPDNPFFAEWASANGYSKVGDSIGFVLHAQLGSRV